MVLHEQFSFHSRNTGTIDGCGGKKKRGTFYEVGFKLFLTLLSGRIDYKTEDCSYGQEGDVL